MTPEEIRSGNMRAVKVGIVLVVLMTISILIGESYTPGIEVTGPQEFSPGTVADIPAGYRVQGDVEVAKFTMGPFALFWDKYYDNKSFTGQIVEIIQPARIRAPWGASVNQLSLLEIEEGMKKSGCLTGCEYVFIGRWSCWRSSTEDFFPYFN